VHLGGCMHILIDGTETGDSFLAGLVQLDKEARNSRENDDLVIKLMRNFYGEIEDPLHWKIILLGFIFKEFDQQKLEEIYFKRPISEKTILGEEVDEYIRSKVYPYVSIFPFSDTSVNVFEKVFQELPFLTRSIIQNAINSLILEGELSLLAKVVILKWNRSDMQNILLPQTLETLLFDTTLDKAMRLSVLYALAGNEKMFTSAISEKKLKAYCEKGGFSRLTFVLLFHHLRGSMAYENKYLMSLFPTIQNGDVEELELERLCNILEKIIIDYAEAINLLRENFSQYCSKVQEAIREKIGEIFQYSIIKKNEKFFLSGRYGFRELSDEEAEWLKENCS